MERYVGRFRAPEGREEIIFKRGAVVVMVVDVNHEE